MAKKPGPKPTKKFDDEWGDTPLFNKSSLADGTSQPLQGDALLKETCRRLRAAKGLWDAHRNPACRREREKALALYNQLTKAQKEKVPQQLRIWLRYRSEKYFGAHQTKPGSKKRSAKGKPSQAKKKGKGRK
ncbi:MAG: hypothetical protein AB8B99_06755 [Phormidesmis sp.]